MFGIVKMECPGMGRHGYFSILFIMGVDGVIEVELNARVFEPQDQRHGTGLTWAIFDRHTSAKGVLVTHMPPSVSFMIKALSGSRKKKLV